MEILICPILHIFFNLEIYFFICFIRILRLTTQQLRLSARGMSGSGGRNRYVKGASNPTNVTEEVRDLVRNQRHAENVDSWRRGIGLDPVTSVTPVWRPNVREDLDNDQEFDMTYVGGQADERDLEEDLEAVLTGSSPLSGGAPPLVLLAQRVKTLKGEPWWIKQTCERLGLGPFASLTKRVAVPNLTFYTSKLYMVKHVVKVIPVNFAQGTPLPSREEFDPKAAKLTSDGRLYFQSKDFKERHSGTQSEPALPDRLSMRRSTYVSEGYRHWNVPFVSPLGNSNYHRNTKRVNPDMTNWATDSATKHKY